MPNITAIPTLMAFREGVLVFAQPGALPPQELDRLITAVRDLDMEQVHAAVAANGPEGSADSGPEDGTADGTADPAEDGAGPSQA